MKFKFYRRYADLLIAALLVGSVCVVFHKTVFEDSSISRVEKLARTDTIFSKVPPVDETLSKQPDSQARERDIDLVRTQIPYYLHVGRDWKQGQLPLWNNDAGFGAPLLADPQSAAFSPLHILLAFAPTLRMYNLTLILQIAVAAIGSFFLSRALGLSRIPALVASVSYTYCPYLLHFQENIGAGISLLPLLGWSFARVSQNKRYSIFVACVCGTALIFSSQPGIAFFDIIFSAILLCVLRAFRKNADILTAYIHCVRDLFLLGCGTLFLSAPFLVPYLEYLANGEFHVFAKTAPDGVALSTLAFNLLKPTAAESSPFVGALTTLGIAVALVSLVKHKQAGSLFQPGQHLMSLTRTMAVFAICLALLISKVWPLNLLLNGPPLSAIIVDYALPSYLLSLSLLGALGLQILVREMQAERAVSKKRARITALFVMGAFIIIQLNAAVPALPITSVFSFPQTDVTKFLTAQKENRITATGRDTLTPNIASVYGLNDIRDYNRIQPKRFLTFMDAASAVREHSAQWFTESLSPILKIGSVKYLVCHSPVIFANATDELNEISFSKDLKFGQTTKTVTATNLSYGLSADRSGCFGSLTWSSQNDLTNALAYSLFLLDNKGETLWKSNAIPVGPFTQLDKNWTCTSQFSVPLTSATKKKAGDTSVAIQLIDLQKSKPLMPQQSTSVEPLLVFAHIPASAPSHVRKIDTSNSGNTLELVKECDHQIRIYKSADAMPRAYFVSEALFVRNEYESLAYIRDSRFDPFKKVILETEDTTKTSKENKLPPAPPTHAKRPSPEGTVEFKQISDSKIQLNATCPKDGYIVLTDIQYPGWEATIDGNSSSIQPANYLFMAVPVKAGKHEIVFEYRPKSFYIGVALAALYALAAIAFYYRRRSRAKAQAPVKE